MLAVISPAKSLDFESPLATQNYSQPQFIDQAELLIEELRRLSHSDIAGLMKLSDQLAELNLHRYHNFQTPFTPKNARQAILAFRGDVYQGLDADTLSQSDFEFAQAHLRILSGLYGLLRPLDLIQPYRLEMGTPFGNQRGKNLYQFWGDRVQQALIEELKQDPAPVLVNLASNEYFKVIVPKTLPFPIITPIFKDFKNGQYKVISFFAKRARGMMARFIIENRIQQVEDLKQFNIDGYRFDPSSSNAKDWVFLRNPSA
jgi:hypothetical protein